jgi:hypothetical protein
MGEDQAFSLDRQRSPDRAPGLARRRAWSEGEEQSNAESDGAARGEKTAGSPGASEPAKIKFKVQSSKFEPATRGRPTAVATPFEERRSRSKSLLYQI